MNEITNLDIRIAACRPVTGAGSYSLDMVLADDLKQLPTGTNITGMINVV